MTGITFATLRARRGGFIGAFIALCCAAAFVAACGILLETGLSGSVAPQRYAGAPIVVAADQNLHFVKDKHGKTKAKSKPATETVRIPDSAFGLVRAVPGVARAVPEMTFPAAVLGRQNGSSWGHGWGSASLTPFTLAAGRAPTAADEVVLDAHTGVPVGASVLVQTPAATRRYTVVGVTKQALDGQRAIFFADSTAEGLAGDRLTAVGVWPTVDSDPTALTAALARTGLTVYTGDDRGVVEFRDATRARVTLISISGALGGTALLVAILVVVGTFALSIEQRSRDIALLRAVGATPRQIRRMVGREAVVLGVVAAGLGSVAGMPLAFWLHGRFVAYHAIPPRLNLVTNPIPLVAAVLVTVAAGWIAARVAARRTSRIRPTAALAESATTSRRRSAATVVAGLLVLAAGIGAIVSLVALHSEAAAMPVTMLSVVACATGLTLLGPLVARIGAVLLAGPMRLLSRTTGFLAAENIGANTRRLAAVTAPTTLAVGMAVTVLFTETTLGGAAQRQVRESVVAGYAVHASNAGVPADVVSAVRATPSVIAATEVLRSTIWLGKNRYPAEGVTTNGLRYTVDPGVVDGSITDLGPGTVAVSTTLGEHVGDTLALRLGDGTPERLRIVATYSRVLGVGAIMLPYDLLAAHVDVPLAASVLIAAPPSAEPALRATIASHPGVALLDRASIEAQDTGNTDAAVRYVALGLIVAFTAIAIVNTLAMATFDRRPELTLLHLIGMTRRQLLRMVRVETLAAVAIALVLGSALGLATLAAFALGMTGSPVPTVTAGGCAAIGGVLILLAYLGTAVPTWVMLRSIE